MMITYFSLYKPLVTLELLLAEHFYTRRLKRNSHFWLKYILSVLTCLGLSLIPWQPQTPMGMVAVFLLLFALTYTVQLICYDVPAQSLLFCTLAGYNTQHFAYCLGNVVRLLVYSEDAVFGLYTGQLLEAGHMTAMETVAHISAFFIMYISYYAFFHLFSTKIKRGQTPILRSRSLLWVSLLSLTVSVFVNAFVMYSGAKATLTIVINAYNAVCCLFIMYMLFSLQDKRRMMDELERIKDLLDQSREQYDQSKKNIELINIKCHDLKHQLRTIGEANRIDESALAEMSDIINIYDSEIRTGHPALDTILTEKSLYCYKNHVSLSCIADGTLLGFMTDAEIYSLFGNALDNAIRAVQHISDEDKRVIGLNVCRVRQFVTIQVHNYFESALDFSETGLPLTTKKDKDNHGLGLKSIRYIVEKYQGMLSVQPEGNVFNLNIMIPLSDPK